MVDPGPDDEGHLDALAELGAGRIRWIVVTHTHPDHAPGAAGLAARTGAEVLGFSERDGFVPSRAVGDGFELHGPGFTLRAVHTPGHASNHLCWFLVERADALLGRPRHAGVDRGHRAARRGHGAVPGQPAHAPGPRPTHRHDRARARLADRAIRPPPSRASSSTAWAREEKVAEALARGRACHGRRAPARRSTPTSATSCFPVARQSLWAHLRKLDADGRARPDDRADIEASVGIGGLIGAR